ncbi:MAG: aminotransferase DegT [Bdellovibrionales bacterium RIFOXYD12_FULL_39_22]|nr:MAG: aminotransferase DegT [Bdellovibrionales bacterium RIFOXYB1_FULL_39_21]OFZ44500.1 MAG: aminotransferase DegT [Bdellovibrionales bacterium RIFOXYC12_FULL_39_17]OFZ49858.1 MAG: aminotransferase DegT [Bdellovibrionales bacterium RIFOXYC1_FULL_39_130]OFZ76863.1 MAG: aminotransferase DegT [Bdellovibrionales bacterium RIFOXYD1_FULL_39_84]OFZ95790.1 MAG: aminotransferase DegT [Bdellovibrionales bacterium RIFOXYD12_FULL_39_22]HLE10808.1 DegT/DnrJ/EryC1/StrS family aminotransferase [Bacteriovor
MASVAKEQKIQFIDLNPQYKKIEKQVQARINKVLSHAQFIMGPEIAELETVLAKFTNSKYCLGVSSGTDALLISLMALDIRPGDEVVVPDFSFFATAGVVSRLGATPVFMDIDARTYNLDPALLEKQITAKTRAIIPVGLYGQAADFDRINEIAQKCSKKYGTQIIVIEDGCQSFGATYKGRKSCNLSHIGCTSFFPTKPLGCYGDGGAIFTNDTDLYERMKSIRVHGQMGRYNHKLLGINGRLDTMQAAVLLAKMEIFEEEMRLRQEVSANYQAALAPVAEKQKITLPFIEEGNISAWAQFTVLFASEKERSEAQKRLESNGIPTACHYPRPMSLQPYYLDLGVKSQCPIAADIASRVMSLPMYPYMGKKEINLVASAL